MAIGPGTRCSDAIVAAFVATQADMSVLAHYEAG
jgi:hypothetical protein